MKATGNVLLEGTRTPIELMLDTGASINVIPQSFVVKHDLQRINGDLPSPQVLTGKEVYCYGAHQLRCEITDSWGQKREIESIFYALDKPEEDFLLGLPGLEKANFHIDCAAAKWRFDIPAKAFTINTPSKFAKKIRNEPMVYALMVSKSLPQLGVAIEPTMSLDITINSLTIPFQYNEYAAQFSDIEAGKLPSFKQGDHAIELIEGTEPPFGPLYNLSQTELKALREYLDDAVAKGTVRHSTSPAGAPILFVPKKDGGLRLCVDYRGLNKVTIKNRHPLPLIGETLDRLCGAKIFSKLDLKDAFNRLRIREGDEWKTAFRTRYGHFEYLVMPFGMANAPATFQAYINKALAGYIDDFCVVYLDDILIYSQNEEEHCIHVKKVLERFKQYQLFVNLKKCEFSTTQVEFLGFIVSQGGVGMDKRRVQAIEEWPAPKSYRDIQVFLGFANFYRRFISHYSKIAAPITELLKGSIKGKKSNDLFRWTDAAEKAFNELCVKFTQAPMLRHYDPGLPNRLETDASQFAVAAIFTQLQSNGI